MRKQQSPDGTYGKRDGSSEVTNILKGKPEKHMEVSKGSTETEIQQLTGVNYHA